MNKFSDDRFSPDRTDLYDLIFEVQFNRFRFILQSNDEVFWLEDYYLGSRNTLETAAEKIQNIIAQHPFLTIPYWKSVKVVSDFQIHTLVPKEFFQSKNAVDYIGYLYPNAHLDLFDISYEEANTQFVVFGTYKAINQIFQKQYQQLQVILTSTTAVGVKYYSFCDTKLPFVVVSESFIEVYIKSSKTHVSSAIKKSIEKLNEVPALKAVGQVYGEVTPFSSMYPNLENTLREIEMGQTPNAHRLANHFRDVATTRYFHLLASLN